MQLQRSPAEPVLTHGRAILLFAVMCLIWGLTWIAIRAGVEALPPVFFAACRFLAAGPLLLAMAWFAGHRATVRGHGFKIFYTAMLANTVCYGTLFWGLRYVPTGFSAVINLSLIPVGVFVIAVIAGQDRFSWTRMAAVALGVAGLFVMFRGRAAIDPSPEALAGAVSIVIGTLSFCLGSVLTRPLARALPALVLAGWHCILGGAGLAIVSLLLESPTLDLFAAFAQPPVLAGWAFLVFGGSIVAYTIFLRLLVAWGPTAASGYSFISPAIAALVGAAVLGERYTAAEGIGALIMFSATFLMLRTTGR
ncbi:MAG: EamA family transporter [Alphaproteobacteria bacterium]|nr:EamA family transporter [Alphaproteobacteria bacterium]